jgi:hypothetical protein
MAKKQIKNNHNKVNIFANPDNEPWGKNVWGTKFSMIGFVILAITGAIVFYADSKGLIDWKQSGDPMQQTHPLLKEKVDTLKY